MAALLIKESVNQTVDNMGFYNALNACFTLHELNHATGRGPTRTDTRSAWRRTAYRIGGRLGPFHLPPRTASGQTRSRYCCGAE